MRRFSERKSKMNQSKPESRVVQVDTKGNVYASGVQLGKLSGDGKNLLIADRDRRRSQARGTRIVAVPLAELSSLTTK